MRDEIDRKSEFIYDRSLQQLAVNIGIFGIICEAIVRILRLLIIINHIVASDTNFNLLLFWLDILGYLSFFFSILISIGYVAIFSLKGSRLGIFFPLSTILYHFVYELQMYILPGILIQSVLYYIFIVIQALILLSIRKKSTNPQFLLVFVIFILITVPISYVNWWLLQLTLFIELGLTLILFSIERKEVFIEDNRFVADSYY